jgi:5-(carboxyamino)imidazole ribonucleotide synthase
MMRVAVIGGGQLARMMALDGLRLGIQFSFLVEPDESTQCVDGLGEKVVWDLGELLNNNDDAAFRELFDALGRPQVVTVEKEAVPVEILRGLTSFTQVYPGPEAVYQTQHRAREKQLLSRLAIPTANFKVANTFADVREAYKTFGLPLFIKAVESGYDGKNQWQLHSLADLESFERESPAGPWVVEQHVRFDREASLIGARSATGETVFYPLTENLHRRGILIRSLAPAPNVSAQTERNARDYMERLFNDLNYVGVLAMECFVCGDDLLVNELAPRVHNSGHWTMDAGICSQFENHVRAIVDWPLGQTQPQGPKGMVNILGSRDLTKHQPRQPGPTWLSGSSTFHWYNKTDRPGRKLGHINFAHNDLQTLQEQLAVQDEHLYGEPQK